MPPRKAPRREESPARGAELNSGSGSSDDSDESEEETILLHFPQLLDCAPGVFGASTATTEAAPSGQRSATATVPAPTTPVLLEGLATSRPVVTLHGALPFRGRWLNGRGRRCVFAVALGPPGAAAGNAAAPAAAATRRRPAPTLEPLPDDVVGAAAAGAAADVAVAPRVVFARSRQAEYRSAATTATDTALAAVHHVDRVLVCEERLMWWPWRRDGVSPAVNADVASAPRS